jgi:hypothetical protein
MRFPGRPAGGIAAAAFVAAMGAAQAAYVPKSDAQIFADYVKSPHHQAFLLKSFNDLEPPPLKAKCAKLAIAALDPPLVLQPAEFAQIGNEYIPSVGRWVQRATLNRCGGKAIRRLYLQADPRDGSLHAQAMLPGEFPGNIQLENDATRIVLPGMMGVAKCSDFKTLFVLDTKLTSPPKPEGWSETWTAQACGRTVTADVIYAADPTGMNITAKNLKLVR